MSANMTKNCDWNFTYR